MIEIKINRSKHSIPAYSELKLSEYKELLKAIEGNKDFSLMDYISFITDWNYKNLMLQQVKGIELLSGIIGQLLFCRGENELNITSIEDLPCKDYFKFGKYIIQLKDTKLKSKIGYRIVIEQRLSKKPSYLEIYQYTLAVIINEKINGNFDIDDIEKVYIELEKHNAYDVLSTGAFFFFNIKRGGNRGLSYLNRLKRRILIRTRG